jgi:ABC-type transporter Mla MlaB component
MTDETNLIRLGNGETYKIDDLPDEIKTLVKLYERWNNEKLEAQIEVNKCDAACVAVSTEISARLKQSGAAPLDPEAAPAQAVAPATKKPAKPRAKPKA